MRHFGPEQSVSSDPKATLSVTVVTGSWITVEVYFPEINQAFSGRFKEGIHPWIWVNRPDYRVH
jgi:hypothetical protein